MKYKVIYADPPWDFKVYSDKGKGRSPKYDTMSIDKIENLPIDDWADKDCALFMWVIDTHIPQALSLIDKWGFTYKTRIFDWVKLTKKDRLPFYGLGYYTRKGSEICFLATKGRPIRKSRSVRQVLLAPVREHSRKPDEYYKMIEALFDGPYIELFARQSVPGWHQYGNETNKFEFKQEINETASSTQNPKEK